ncbi:MAG TPA: hypothetical protein VG223_14970 [Solirubrobacteraceae bacterium]|nr:hypothetical protein [Solirubrobacteraceae bacterium]
MEPSRRDARARTSLLLSVVAASAVLVVALTPGLARADGDPASDVLTAQSAFLPIDAGATAGQQARLDGVLAAARRVGYPLRVAVIASPADLGSIGQLWHRPQAYAEFLGEELSLASPGRVLVVMPDGFGLYQPGVTPAGDLAQLQRTPAPPRSRQLATVATDAVGNLAASSGHPLPAGADTTPLTAPVASGGSGATWAALIVGALLIAVAWTLSLRARPLRLREQRS